MAKIYPVGHNVHSLLCLENQFVFRMIFCLDDDSNEYHI